jgi:hypothetical protein
MHVLLFTLDPGYVYVPDCHIRCNRWIRGELIPEELKICAKMYAVVVGVRV